MPSTENITFCEDLSPLPELLRGRKAFAIVDGNVPAKAFEKYFDKGNILPLDACEAAKKIETVEYLAGQLLEKGADRESLLVAVGGGITTDVTGLLAALYMRGIPMGSVPTTLLAQVDASIGGKNGVNLGGWKNILGTFRRSEFICICPEMTATESAQSRLCGAVEMLKTFLIADEASYRRAVEHFKAGGSVPPMSLISRAVAIKCDITGKDPFDRGQRKLLNLGHTFGHAIEKCSGGTISHGMAVAQGIIIAARISRNEGIMEGSCLESLLEDWRLIHLPVETAIPAAALADAILKDKKRKEDSIDFVLPVKPGKAVIRAMLPSEIVKSAGK